MLVMKPVENDWYKKIWTLDIQNQSWVEDTKRQIDFVIEKLHLTAMRKFSILPAVLAAIPLNWQGGDFQ